MEDKITDIIVDICEDEGVRTQPDLDLFDASLLDSIAFLQLLVAIENELQIVIQPTEVERSDMNTVNKIISQIRLRME